MPLPTLLLLCFGIGVGAALAAGEEMRHSPRPAMMTRSFRAFALFIALVLLPICIYFYVFHGDWFLLYLVDVKQIPSALALVGVLLFGAVGVGGFRLGASLARSQRTGLATGAIAGCAVLAVLSLFLLSNRLAVIGSFAQFQGGFGLMAYGEGPLMYGGLAMGAIMVAGVVFLILRLRYSSRRTQ